MKGHWRSIVRVFAAILVAWLVVYWLDGLIATALIDNELYGNAQPGTLFFVVLNAGVAFVAFLAGGLAAPPKVTLVAFTFASLIQVNTIWFWAGWSGRTMAATLAVQWFGAVAFILFAVLGASFGSLLQRAIKSHLHPAAA